MIENLVAGLVSGLIVSFLVLVVGKFWRAVIEPWFEEKVYKDLRIEGKWYSLYVDAADYRQEVVNIKRKGHSIEGIMMCKTGVDEGEEYTISGSFRNMLLPLTYEARDRKKSDRGTVTLMSTHNGERLVGKVALYHTKYDEIETAPVIWFRNKEHLSKTIEYIEQHREEYREMMRQEEEVREQFFKFFEEYGDEFRRRQTQEEERTIEGEVEQIEHRKAG
ncbi:hypothetical protein I2702_004778 [Vibrio parahaemolyticus]|uniref:hypothetical protein n=1 Tax=Vibrio alginolyticus TaxID=663 RepID=UPI00193DA78D|nr:hypothetical protein [Vibrio parahaemolyticus]MBM4864748.1 hypothetical protein [Vibrio parahaemolyticus]